ncbi:Kinase, NEK [Spironucleus salmonicida]|uniref:non-specific serine/threonine protein kinase n=1 Tax=Spironucleus salmonicida TaxID=348837 RepID=V6LA76_9EUKA|nr:Kinase, NEK [Spironucleus salmonicida]|eukprot:EST41325.1 Kinase, NEK [Spironucleus salmonicida]
MNRYKELKTLGKGSFGRAALVEEIATKEKFVMKIIQISQMKPKEREEALQESRILEKLQHPNITSYRESFSDAKFLYIVMEYANSGDLYERIKAQKAKGALFPEAQVWEWTIQICLGLKHIHDRRILHRDLKTQNIFLSVEGGRHVCKIGDFGVSKILNSTMECARTAIGTPYYLSPELCNNQGYNNKSDIWALGCMIYEICTLNHTFEAANMKMLIVKILEGKYKPISSVYSSELRDLLTMMLQKDPKKRPSVNSILKMPSIQTKLHKFLPETVKEMEFAHTVFHGQGNIMKGFKEEDEIKQIMGGAALFGNAGGQKPAENEVQKVVVQPPGINYPTNLAKSKQQVTPMVKQVTPQAKQATAVKRVAPVSQQKSSNSVPSDNTLFGKLNELDDLLAMKSPSSQDSNKPVQQQQLSPNYNPFSYPTPQNLPTPPQNQQSNQSNTPNNPLAYNPPPQFAQKNAQKNLNNHQKDVISKLAPMNDRDRARYMREKELQDKKDRAQQLKRQSEEKIANAKAAVKQKYEKINHEYDSKLQAKKESMYRDEEDLARRAKILEDNKKAEMLAKKQYELEQKRLNSEIAEKERKKGEDQREKLRQMMAQKRKEKGGGNQFGEIEVIEEAGAGQKMREKFGEGGADYQKNLQAKASVDMKQPEKVCEEESESFGDAPDANFAQANAADEWKNKLNSTDGKESLCYRMESLRSFMEKQLGFDKFMNVYQSVNNASANDEEMDDNYVREQLGDDNMGYMNLIVQLILVEQKFNESQ